MDNNKLSILINSCDAYSDCWYPFFRLFDEYGGALKELPIILNTETKQYSYPGLNIICSNSVGEELAWAGRIKHALTEINTPYVLTLLDDFFFRKPVDMQIIEKCVSWLDANDKVGCFNFDPIGKDSQQSNKYDDFCLLPINTPWRCNSQAAIWRKTVLDKSMLQIESPWEWEQKGTLRNNIILKDVEFYALRHHTPMPIEYGLSKVKDFGIVQGKWLQSDVVPLFEEHGIQMDYSVRGFCEERQYTDLTGVLEKRQNQFVQFVKDVTRPVRLLPSKIKHNHPKTDEEKNYYALVTLPVREYKRGNKKWDKIDYRRK